MENTKTKNILRIVIYAIYTLIVVFAVVALLSMFSVGGIKFFAVQSGSMEPVVKTGSLVFVRSQDSYQVGDIITYKNFANKKEITTHRIVGAQEMDGLRTFQTKGDANNALDEGVVSQDEVVGKHIFSINYLGYVIGYIKTLPGLIFIIIIPAAIIIYEEAKKIFREAKQIAHKKREAKKFSKSENTKKIIPKKIKRKRKK